MACQWNANMYMPNQRGGMNTRTSPQQTAQPLQTAANMSADDEHKNSNITKSVIHGHAGAVRCDSRYAAAADRSGRYAFDGAEPVLYCRVFEKLHWV